MAVLIDPPAQPVVGYNFSDIEDGRGTVTYYLYTSKDASATNYIMGQEVPYSRNITLPITSGDYVVGTHTYTFYSGQFNTTRVMNGSALFNFFVGATCAANLTTIRVSIKMYHYDGSTSTQIGSTWISEDFEANNGSVTETTTGIVTADDVTFTVDDQIKLEIIVEVEDNAADVWEVGIDPQNRDANQLTPSSAAESTIFSVKVPFRIFG